MGNIGPGWYRYDCHKYIRYLRECKLWCDPIERRHVIISINESKKGIYFLIIWIIRQRHIKSKMKWNNRKLGNTKSAKKRKKNKRARSCGSIWILSLDTYHTSIRVTHYHENSLEYRCMSISLWPTVFRHLDCCQVHRKGYKIL